MSSEDTTIGGLMWYSIYKRKTLRVMRRRSMQWRRLGRTEGGCRPDFLTEPGRARRDLARTPLACK
jgi:hypothetical protein